MCPLAPAPHHQPHVSSHWSHPHHSQVALPGSALTGLLAAFPDALPEPLTFKLTAADGGSGGIEQDDITGFSLQINVGEDAPSLTTDGRQQHVGVHRCDRGSHRVTGSPTDTYGHLRAVTDVHVTSLREASPWRRQDATAVP